MTSVSNSPEVWPRVLSHPDYFDLKRLRSVSKSLLDCCRARLIQEALFTASANEPLLDSNFEAEDEIQLRPIFSQASYYLYKRPSYTYAMPGHDQRAKRTDTFHIENCASEALKKVKNENATNPPVSHLKLYGQFWDAKSIDNFYARILEEEEEDHDLLPSDEESESGDEGRMDLKEVSPSSSTAITVGHVPQPIPGNFKENDGFKKIKWEALPLSRSAEDDWEMEH